MTTMKETQINEAVEIANKRRALFNKANTFAHINGFTIVGYTCFPDSIGLVFSVNEFKQGKGKYSYVEVIEEVFMPLVCEDQHLMNFTKDKHVFVSKYLPPEQEIRERVEKGEVVNLNLK